MSRDSRTQAQIWRYLWYHPNASIDVIARQLKISYGAAQVAKFRLLRRPEISRRCPECWQPSLLGLVCQNCGVELDAPSIPQGVRFEETSPVHSIQSGNGLGSSTSYSLLHLQYGGRNIQHLVERSNDPLLERAKSELWQSLKEVMPQDGAVEEANRLLIKEVIEFETKYPNLSRAKGVSKELARHVVGLMALRYPALRRIIVLEAVA